MDITIHHNQLQGLDMDTSILSLFDYMYFFSVQKYQQSLSL